MLILPGNGLAPTLHDYLREQAQRHPDITLLPASLGKHKSSAPFSELFAEVEGQSVVVVQSLARIDRDTMADFTWQLLLTVAELKRHGAEAVWAITPYNGHVRQDRGVNGRKVSIAIDTFADMLKHAGAKGISLVEIHSAAAQAQLVNHFGPGQVFNLRLTDIFANCVARDIGLGNLATGGPDAGSDERSTALAKRLGSPEFHFEKTRVTVNDTQITGFTGDVRGRKTITTDDEIDTAGTIVHAQEDLMERGAIERHVFAPHGVFSDGGLERIFTAGARHDRTVTSLTVSDTIDMTFELERLKRQYRDLDDLSRIRQVSIGPLLWDHVANDIANHPAMKASP